MLGEILFIFISLQKFVSYKIIAFRI